MSTPNNPNNPDVQALEAILGLSADRDESELELTLDLDDELETDLELDLPLTVDVDTSASATQKSNYAQAANDLQQNLTPFLAEAKRITDAIAFIGDWEWAAGRTDSGDPKLTGDCEGVVEVEITGGSDRGAGVAGVVATCTPSTHTEQVTLYSMLYSLIDLYPSPGQDWINSSTTLLQEMHQMAKVADESMGKVFENPTLQSLTVGKFRFMLMLGASGDWWYFSVDYLED